MNIIFWDKEQFFFEIKKATNNNEKYIFNCFSFCYKNKLHYIRLLNILFRFLVYVKLICL